MKNTQRQIIKDFSMEIYDIYSPREAFVALADQWDLASNFERLLGPEGRISFPMERPQVEIGEIEDELTSLERAFRLLYGEEQFTITVSAPSNKLEIAVWDVEKNEQIVRKSYNKILDFLNKNAQEREGCYFSHSDIAQKADRIAQKVSQRSVKQSGTMYISALPEDILTASINLQGWNSCFDNEGENSVTPYHLVRSRRTLIAFFIPDNAENRFMDHCGHKVYNKYWRTLIYQSTDGSFFASSNSYPSKSEVLTTAALIRLVRLDGRAATIKEDIYPRYQLHGYCDGTGLSAIFNYEEGNKYEISSPHQLCPLSGKPYYNEINQSITCSKHNIGKECYSCGNVCHKDDMVGVIVTPDGDEEDYCEYCLDEASYCGISGYTYSTINYMNTASKFIDEDGVVSDVVTCYAEEYLDKYTLTLYTNSDDYKTYKLYGDGVHGLLTSDQVMEITDRYRLPDYKLAILTADDD